MAIMAAAAFASTAAVGAGLVTVSTVAMIGVGATVVGMATGSKLLTKIGAGVGLGGAAAGLAGIAPVTGAAGGAAGGTGLVSGGEGLGLNPGVAQGAVTEAATEAAQSAVGASSGLDVSLDGGFFDAGPANYSPSTGLSSSGGAVGSAGGSTGQGLVSSTGVSAVGVPSPGLAKGAEVSAWADAGVVSASTPMPAPWYAAKTAFEGQQLQSSTSFWDGFKNFWKGLDSPSKLAVGQIGAGLVKGVGEGMMTASAEDRKYDALENEREYRRRNMSFVPRYTFNSGLVGSALPQG